MAAVTGFVASSPVARGGASGGQSNLRAYKYVAPAGVNEVTEIGCYCYALSVNKHGRFAIFSHDAVNNCPEAALANGVSAEVVLPTGSMTKSVGTFAAGSRPQLTAGATYWLVWITDDATVWYSRDDVGTNGVGSVTFAYPTFPTGDAWHAHADSSVLAELWAVYAAAGGGGGATGNPTAMMCGQIG